MRLANSRDRRRRMCAFYCSYCRKPFSTRQARRNHLSVHEEEVRLRRCLYRSDNPTHCSDNVLIPSMPLFNLEASPSSFSPPVNVDANSHLIVPPNLFYSSCSSMVPPVAQIGDGNSLQNHLYPNLRNKKPYVEDRPKKELLLFKDVSSIDISSEEDEEEVEIDLDLSLHL